jgi:mono/diheme cytochrome c family protein
MKRYLTAVTLGCLCLACRNNKEEVAETCSTANVRYTTTIASIISANNCLSCHSGTAPQGGFPLQTYEQVKSKASETRNGNSVLYGATAHLNGFSPMPQGGQKLNSCELAMLKAWIDNGMPQ